MTTTFDLYDGETKVQTGVSSPILIDGLNSDTEYTNYSVSYSGKSDKTPVSFKTKAAANVPVTGVTMSQKTASMKVGDTKQVTATVAPEDATNKNVTYASDNEEIATIDATGNIVAVAVGSANVTVTTADGSFTDKTAVTVAEAS
ncbi:Ig domain-containing protein [Weissella kandleri]|uniref:Ig-like domain-containing protein n=1 Tax=Weissella kandleri TaxID=1616 RepID=UPI00387E9534